MMMMMMMMMMVPQRRTFGRITEAGYFNREDTLAVTQVTGYSTEGFIISASAIEKILQRAFW